MTPKGADLEATDLIEVSTIESGSYVTRSITGQELIDAIPLPPTGLTVGTTPIASGTNGRVLFQGTGNVLQQSSSLFWDSTNNRLGIGTSTAPSGSVYIDNSGNDIKQHLILKNSDAGSSAQVHLDLHNNVSGSSYSSGASLFLCSSTTAAPYASALGFWNYLNAPIVLATNATERMRVASTGNVLINTTTDAGFRLDVNGTARVSGATTITLNANSTTSLLNITNLNAGTSSRAILTTQSSTALGQFGTVSSTWNATSDILPNETYVYGQNGVLINTLSSQLIRFNIGTERMRIASTGNVLINTTTDAGFRLDVNGTARVQGNLDLLFTSVTNNPYLNIFSETQTNSRPIVFNTAGTTGGAASGYEFRAGFGGSNGSTAFRIWGGSTTSTRVGIGNLTESNLQGGNAQVYINSQITGGRNAGVRITPPSTSTTEFSGIQFDIINKDSNGGAFIGSQYNPLTNGYDTDLVILTTGTSPNSYSQTARFMGKYNSFYVGTDKTLAVASAKMQVESTTQGFLPPRMTTTQKNAIASPATGLQVYDTTLNQMSYYNGTTWTNI
jgi:hypothetical protein